MYLSVQSWSCSQLAHVVVRGGLHPTSAQCGHGGVAPCSPPLLGPSAPLVLLLKSWGHRPAPPWPAGVQSALTKAEIMGEGPREPPWTQEAKCWQQGPRGGGRGPRPGRYWPASTPSSHCWAVACLLVLPLEG